jgi:hypothetical protein
MKKRPIYREKRHNAQEKSQKAGAKAAPPLSPPIDADPQLSAVVKSWPDLPLATKAGIVAMVLAVLD